MRGGISSWICLASLAAGGCATTQAAEVKIRSIPDAAAKLRSGSTLLADATGQLALGNVGLALEGFRKTLREQPNSPEAYAGIAKCYEAMGRFDLARSNYEAALALTPQNSQLLTAVAVALDQQGNAQAASVARQDAAAAQSASRLQMPQPRIDPTASVTLSSSITVQLPPARRPDDLTAMAPSITLEPPPRERSAEAPKPPMPQPNLPRPAINKPAAVALRSSQTVETVAGWPTELMRSLGSRLGLEAMPSMTADQQVKPPVPAPLPRPRADRTAPMALEPGRGVKTLASSAGLLRTLAATFGLDLEPAPARRTERAFADVAEPPRGPYLERLSPGEVALVTDGRPAWRAQLVAQTRTATTVRWIPIMTAEARPNIRILNAAQRQGLAAQTRSVLLDRGWRKIQVATAADQRQRSVVLYPASRRTLGRSLAAQFGFPSQLQNEANVLIVLLGRDAARPVASARRG